MSPTSPAARTVLFICTGNYYRSRVSEAWFNHLAMQAGSPWRAFSRGVDINLAPPGLSPFTRDYLGQLGVSLDLTAPERQALQADDLARAAHAIALKEAEHRAYLRRDFPAWEERVTYWHFHDLDVSTAETMLPALERHVRTFFEGLHAPAR
jgi:protein-tyrosine phosphatase